MRTYLIGWLFFLLFVPAIVNGAGQIQEAADDSPALKLPAPAPRARWKEDWSTLGEHAAFGEMETPTIKGTWPAIKHISLGKNKNHYLSLGGEARLAWETYKDKDMGISDIGSQDALQLRLALTADWHINTSWRVFGEMGFGKVNERDGGKKTADETDPDIWQLFAGYRMPVGEDNDQLVFRAGRQIIETANLFINAGEGNNVRQVYDGFRMGWISDRITKLDVFAAEYINFSDDSFDMSGTGEYFWGFRAGAYMPEPDMNLHLFYSGWDLNDRQFEQGGGGRHDEQRHTLMLWLDRSLSENRQWALDYYLAYQFGEYEDQEGSDINAFALFGETKYAFSTKAKTPLAGFKTAYFSGDNDPNDDELNTFYNPVFATPYFGYARDIQPFNLIFLQPYIGYLFGKKALVTLGHGFHWRADTNDAYYGAPNGITARADSSDSSWLGQQTQLSIRYWPLPNVLISSYLAHFFAGDMIKDAGGKDRDYVHIGIHYLF